MVTFDCAWMRVKVMIESKLKVRSAHKIYRKIYIKYNLESIVVYMTSLFLKEFAPSNEINVKHEGKYAKMVNNNTYEKNVFTYKKITVTTIHEPITNLRFSLFTPFKLE